MFIFVGSNSPPLPAGASPPPQWGSVATITERLAPHFETPFFERDTMYFPALSIAHYRLFMERSVGPMQKLVDGLAGEPQGSAALRAEYDAIIAPHFRDNLVIHQSYIMTRASALMRRQALQPCCGAGAVLKRAATLRLGLMLADTPRAGGAALAAASQAGAASAVNAGLRRACRRTDRAARRPGGATLRAHGARLGNVRAAGRARRVHRRPRLLHASGGGRR